eukprot:3109561-Prymnesium_polylepis.1
MALASASCRTFSASTSAARCASRTALRCWCIARRARHVLRLRKDTCSRSTDAILAACLESRMVSSSSAMLRTPAVDVGSPLTGNASGGSVQQLKPGMTSIWHTLFSRRAAKSISLICKRLPLGL